MTIELRRHIWSQLMHRQSRSIRILSLMSPMILLALTVSSCSPPPATDTVSTPAAPPDAAPSAPAAPVRHSAAVLPDGFTVNLELAITPDELAQGLMFRPKLADDRGMLLLFSEERFPNIWMMNTLVALDIIYLDDSGLVVDVITDAQPCPGEPCPRFAPKQAARAVLEIPAGGASRHGIVEGTTISFVDVPGFPFAD
jgi:hypothetical protein